MRVAIVSDLETHGGAAIAATRISSSLADESIEVVRVTGQINPGSERRWDVHEIIPKNKIYKGIRLHAPARVFHPLSRAVTKARIHRVLKRIAPDVINVHNLHMGARDGWSPEIAELCVRIAPTVWTLHDMWSFTGGCHHAYECNNYQTGCDRRCLDCFDHEALEGKSIRDDWNHRKELLDSSPALSAVAPSRWLADRALASLWRGHRVEVIPNPLRTDVYAPMEKEVARRGLGIDHERPVLLTVGQYFDERRRGLDLLIGALARIERARPTLLMMGEMKNPPRVDAVDVRSVGTLTDDDEKARTYSAADLMIHPSRAENLPNVIAESLACGTPVVAFPVGGIPEMVKPGESGWLAADVSEPELGEALHRGLSDIERGRDLRASSRNLAITTYDAPAVAARYISLFRSLIEADRG